MLKARSASLSTRSRYDTPLLVKYRRRGLKTGRGDGARLRVIFLCLQKSVATLIRRWSCLLRCGRVTRVFAFGYSKTSDLFGWAGDRNLVDDAIVVIEM